MDGVFKSVNTQELVTGKIRRTGESIITTNASSGRPGGTATVGYVKTGTDQAIVTLAQNATADTWVIPINLKDGTVITGIGIHGQADSAGNAFTVDYELRELIPISTGVTDASLQVGAQIGASADTLIDGHTDLATEHTNMHGEAYYILVTCTTGGVCDIKLVTVDVTVREN